MRSSLTLLAPLLLLLATLGAAEEDAWLRWRNGDELKGSILSGEENKVHWNSPVFGAPLSLGLDQLESIRFPGAKEYRQSTKDSPFRVILRNGDRLEGALLKIGPKSVVVECSPFSNPVSILRTEIERIVNIRSDALRYNGPDELDGWSSSGRDRKTSEWFTDLKGSFATHQWSGNLFRKIEFPSAVEVEFHAEFPLGKPNLEIGLLRSPDEGPMLETWDDFLVLTYGSRFVPVLEVTEETRSLDFRLFWDQNSGDLRLCEPDGKLLASIDGAIVDRPTDGNRASPLDRGFSILNRNPEMRLQSLVVQEWDGSPPPVIDLARPRVLLAGSKPRFGTEDVRLESGSESLRVGSRLVALQQLVELVLSPDSKEASSPNDDQTRAAWFGGTTVSGKFLRLSPTQVAIAPSWSDGPVEVSLAGAREIRFASSESPVVEGRDRLEGEGFALRGSLRMLPEPRGTQLTGWEPPGANQPSPLAEGIVAIINRTPYSSSTAGNPIGQGRVYLDNDEILAGSVVSITEKVVAFTSRVTGFLEIPTERVLAVDIGGAGRVLDGFGDAEWEEIEEEEGEVTVDGDSVVLRGGSFGNPSLLAGDRIHFSAEWAESYGAVTLRLFADGSSTTSPSTDIILAAQGNRLFIGRLKESGAFSFSGDQIPISGSKAEFELQVEPERIKIKVNGKSNLTLATEPDRVSGNGIYFKMGGGWQGWSQKENEIEISDFRIERTPGSLPRRIIDPDAKQNALLVPRGNRDPVPTHLLVAPNGDLLRGFLRAASGDSIRFTSQDETFDLPRHRVSAVVWLQPPAPAESNPENAELENDESSSSTDNQKFEVTHQFTLLDGTFLRLRADRIDNGQFVGRSEILGECSVSLENLKQLREGPSNTLARNETPRLQSFADWQLEFTPDPVIPGSNPTPSSPLIGKPAPEIELPGLDDNSFTLSDAKGSVVVLDFWATWCGPCIRAMPDVKTVVDAFPAGTVVFRAVNQAESATIIEEFLEARNWNDLPVILDFELKASRNYRVEGIPHTVVIGKDGKVAWVHSGYSEELKKALFDAIATELQK